MTGSSEKKKQKKQKQKIKTLWMDDKIQECLEYINSVDDNLLKDLQIYQIKLAALLRLERFEEILVLQKRLKEFGHETTLTYGDWLFFADANKMQNNLLEAYLLYQRVLGHKGASADDEVVKECLECMKKLKPKVQADLDRIAEERATRFLEDERAAASTSIGAASTSAGAASTSAGAASTSAQTAAASTSSTAVASSSSTASTFSSLSLVPSVDDSPPKVMKFTDDGVICFEMTQLDEFSYLGVMKIGGSDFPKSYIKIGENSTSDVSIRLKKNSYLLKIEFSIYSNSLSSRVAIVEPVRPIKMFFELKLNGFKSEASQATAQTCKNWWEYIKDDFHRIFRGVICGMVAIYSDQKVCGSDLENSLYVSEEGEARIFHISEEGFTFTQAQKEVSDLLSISEAIITLIKPRPRSQDLQT